MKRIIFSILALFVVSCGSAMSSGVGGSTGVGGTPSVIPGNFTVNGIFKSPRITDNPINSISMAAKETAFGGGLLDNNVGLEIGSITSTIQTNAYIDFHVSITPVDFDARLITSGGDGTPGGGNLDVEAKTFTINGANNQAYRVYINGDGTCFKTIPDGWGTCAAGTLGLSTFTFVSPPSPNVPICTATAADTTVKHVQFNALSATEFTTRVTDASGAAAASDVTVTCFFD